MKPSSIRRLREHHGLTQAAVARQAGLHQSDVSDVESGKRSSRELTDRVIDGILRSTSPSRVLARHRDTLRAYLTGQGLTRVMVFGSTAAGCDRWNSDLDLVAVMPEDTSLFELVQWEQGLRRLAGGLRVDLVADTPEARKRLPGISEAVPL